MKNSDFKIKFWGVRGSYPVANKNYLKYGGNTSCIEINIGNHRIILDGGTGSIPLGDEIFQEHISSADNVYDRTPMNITLLLSHIHQDHIQGLNFFKPINVFTTHFSVFGYSGIESNLKIALSALFLTSTILKALGYPASAGDDICNIFPFFIILAA